MCFNQPMSFVMAAIGLVMSLILHKGDAHPRISAGMFFFFTMEFLQGIQYWYIDDCDDPTNKILTALGFLHISFQPFFTHFMCSALAITKVEKAKYRVVLGLCIIGGLWLLLRVA